MCLNFDLLTTNDLHNRSEVVFFSEKIKHIDGQIAKLKLARQNSFSRFDVCPRKFSMIFTETLYPEGDSPEDLMQSASCLVTIYRAWWHVAHATHALWTTLEVEGAAVSVQILGGKATAW